MLVHTGVADALVPDFIEISLSGRGRIKVGGLIGHASRQSKQDILCYRDAPRRWCLSLLLGNPTPTKKMGVKISGSGYRSYRAAQGAGSKALDKFLDDVSKETEQA